MSDDTMNIHELRAENFRRIEVVTIRPGGEPVVEIRGANGAGKTSVIDAIAAALGGPRLKLPSTVRAGSRKAKVALDIGKYLVERSFTANGGHSLKVTAKDTGGRVSSPQAMLDELVAPFSFDPLAFLRLPPKDRAASLAKVAGLDFAQLDAARAAAAEERRMLRAQREEAAAALASAGDPGAPPDAPSDADLHALAAKARAARDALGQAGSFGAAHARAGAEVRAFHGAFAQRLKQRKAAEAEIEAMEKRIAEQRSAVAEMVQREAVDRKRYAAMLEAYKATPAVDVDALRAAADEADRALEEARARAGAARQAREQHARLKGLRDRVDDLGQRLALAEKKVAFADDEKKRRVSEAAFPVPGLGFDAEGGVTLNGHSFEAASHAEQLRCAVAMGFAANPRLKVLLVRDGSLLDERSMRLLAEMSAAHGGQVWVEKVDTKGDGAGFLLQEGRLVETTGADAGLSLGGGEVEADGPGEEEDADAPAATPRGRVPQEDYDELESLGDDDFDLDVLAREEVSARASAPTYDPDAFDADGLDLPEMD